MSQIAQTELPAGVMPLLTSVEEAANAVDLSRAEFYKLLTSGEIASFKHGNRRLVSVPSLQEWVANRLQESA